MELGEDCQSFLLLDIQQRNQAVWYIILVGTVESRLWQVDQGCVTANSKTGHVKAAAVPTPVLGVCWRAWVAKATHTCSSQSPGMLLLAWLIEMFMKVGRKLRRVYP